MLGVVAPAVIDTVAGMQKAAPAAERAVVMTMGALHEGHAALIRAARTIVGPGGEVVVTVFVNPLQFAPGEDYERYPRTWQADLDVCAAEGVDSVFAPAAADMYAAGRDVRVVPGPVGDLLEGAVRPGHFAGMLTVVNKLFNLTAAHTAVFGEKDYQQLVLIRSMVAQLNLPVQVVGVPTVREPDGLAMSSRNRYLEPHERTAAAAIPRAIHAAVECADGGGDADAVRVAAERMLQAVPEVDVDYVAVTDPDLGPAPGNGAARILIAAQVGAPRLLDNAALHLGHP